MTTHVATYGQHGVGLTVNNDCAGLICRLGPTCSVPMALTSAVSAICLLLFITIISVQKIHFYYGPAGESIVCSRLHQCFLRYGDGIP